MKETKKEQAGITVSVECPSIPNFIRLTCGQTFPIRSFTPKDLRKIGKLWTEELIKKATKMQ